MSIVYPVNSNSKNAIFLKQNNSSIKSNKCSIPNIICRFKLVSFSCCRICLTASKPSITNKIYEKKHTERLHKNYYIQSQYWRDK